MRAGFGSADITPPPGTVKIGWLKVVTGARVLDPLEARACVLEAAGGRVGVLALDTLSVRYAQVAEIRRRVEARCGLAGGRLLVAATHNHAGPAVANAGDVRRDEAYLAFMTDRAVEAVAAAADALDDAEVGLGAADEPSVAHNRRVVYADGFVRTHGSLRDPRAVGLEGPIDPELAVIAFRAPDGRPLGCLVNFALHPTHHGGDECFSAGWPGALRRALAAAGWPGGIVLQGAMGNIHHTNPAGGDHTEEEIAAALDAAARRALEGATWTREPALAARSRTITLPWRTPSPGEIAGTLPGAQRFIDSAIYDREIPGLLEKMRARPAGRDAEVQALRIGDTVLTGVPAELFVEAGLAIKRHARPRRAVVVGCANGMVGYVPTAAAFPHGGYETTFMTTSCLAPDAADRLVAAATALVAEV